MSKKNKGEKSGSSDMLKNYPASTLMAAAAGLQKVIIKRQQADGTNVIPLAAVRSATNGGRKQGGS